MIYYDEYQRFTPADFATFLAEVRKFRVATTLANQTFEQLNEITTALCVSRGLATIRCPHAGLDTFSNGVDPMTDNANAYY
jgi:hypothetical protein